MQSRRIRQSPGHKTDRLTTEGLGENRRKLIHVPGARLETAKKKKNTKKALNMQKEKTPTKCKNTPEFQENALEMQDICIHSTGKVQQQVLHFHCRNSCIQNLPSCVNEISTVMPIVH